jgi:hypothetical protein
MTTKELAIALKAAGLEAQMASILAQARPAIGLRFAPAGSLTFNRFGGSPEMPAHLEWPECEGKPLYFIGQFQLSTLRAFAAAEILPRQGRLWFFYDPMDFGPGWTEDRRTWRVLFSPSEAEPIAPRPDPAQFDPFSVIRASPLLGHEMVTIPAPRSIELETLNAPEDTPWWERYFEVCDQIERDSAPRCHWMLGHPAPIQGCMQRSAQFVSQGAGEPPKDSQSYYDHPRAAELMPGAHDWRLLLQVDSDLLWRSGAALLLDPQARSGRLPIRPGLVLPAVLKLPPHVLPRVGKSEACLNLRCDSGASCRPSR